MFAFLKLSCGLINCIGKTIPEVITTTVYGLTMVNSWLDQTYYFQQPWLEAIGTSNTSKKILTLNSATVISNDLVMTLPEGSATLIVMTTKVELRLLQMSEVMATPSFHCMSTSWPTLRSLLASSGELRDWP